MAEFFMLALDKVDTSPLRAFLEQRGVRCHDRMLNDVMNAIGRYGYSQEQKRLKYQLKTVRAAAQKLVGAMPKLGSKEYIRFSDAIFRTIPPDAFTERSRGFFDLPTTLQMISAGADDALKKLRGTREGTTAKTDFAIRLARAWFKELVNSLALLVTQPIKNPLPRSGNS
jgi:hypothetical protein